MSGNNLPMANSIILVILATAQEFKAIPWTQDSEFKNISNGKYFPRKQEMTDQSIYRILVSRTGDFYVGASDRLWRRHIRE
jgi:hypothetical protein